MIMIFDDDDFLKNFVNKLISRKKSLVLLFSWQMTSEHFSCRTRQPLRKYDIETNDQIPASSRILGQGESFAHNAFDSRGFDYFILKIDHHSFTTQKWHLHP